MAQWLEFSNFLIDKARIEPLEVEVDDVTHLRGQLLKSCGFTLECEPIHPQHQMYMWSVVYKTVIIAQTMGSGASGAKRAIERMFATFNVVAALETKTEHDERRGATNLPVCT
jgi:hypothetical protein